MIARSIAAVLALVTSAVAAGLETASDLSFTRPAGWERSTGGASHLVVLTPPARHASAAFIEGQDFDGSAEAWHAGLWSRLSSGLKPRGVSTGGRRGDFQTTWAAFDKADGTQSWLCLYTVVKDHRGEGVLFFADGEGPFRSNLTTVNQLVDGITFAPPVAVVATANPPAAAVTPPAAVAPAGNVTASPPPPQTNEDPTLPPPSYTVLPPSASAEPPPPPAAPVAELAVACPAGWAMQQDPQTRAIYMQPPDSPAVNQGALVVFPPVPFAGTPEQFHNQTLATALNQSRLLEPVQQARAGGFLVTAAHAVTATGDNVRVILYTARWADRAQAILFATVRDDIFRRDAPVADAAVRQAQVAVAGDAAGGGLGVPVPPGSGPVAMPAAPLAQSTAGPATSAADDDSTMPVLEYNDPPNFWRGSIGGKNCAEYQGSDVNFTLCVYPFREFQGDIRAQYQQGLLRDWIDVMFREEGVTVPPRFSTNTVPGADGVFEAHFLDPRQQEHHRILITAGRWAAIVDMIAPTAFAWQKGYQSAAVLLQSMHVGRKAAAPSVANGPGPQGAALAGLFQGMKYKTVSNLALGPGYLGSKLALHFYLFSADGRVYRCYDFPPGGSPAAAHRFDFDGAARQDPTNTGRFAIRGNELYIKMGGPNADEITTTVSDPTALTLEDVQYKRVQ